MTEDKRYPIPGADAETLEEALGFLWHRFERGEKTAASLENTLRQTVGEGVLDALAGKGLVQRAGEQLLFSAAGERQARDVVRRHRLSERLMTDVLNMELKAMDPEACRWEHVLSTEAAESICTLLGHPVECPHGHAIPRGECCRRDQEDARPVVVSLDRLSPGEDGCVAYLRLENHPELHKLLSLGLVPGVFVHVHQTYPATVLQVGETQLALEKAVAKNIYVRKN